jgi:hypothetical protein
MVLRFLQLQHTWKAARLRLLFELYRAACGEIQLQDNCCCRGDRAAILLGATCIIRVKQDPLDHSPAEQRDLLLTVLWCGCRAIFVVAWKMVGLAVRPVEARAVNTDRSIWILHCVAAPVSKIKQTLGRRTDYYKTGVHRSRVGRFRISGASFCISAPGNFL